MAYVYQVSFDIQPDQMSELQIGASLERVLGYLRSLLPNETGFVTARAMYSLDLPDATHLVFESTWESWEDLVAHRQSELAEAKVLVEFEPHVSTEHLVAHVFEEVP
jgi:quinol monooxygenase YgiN